MDIMLDFVFIRRPSLSFLTAAFVLAVVSLSPTPTFTPIALLLATLQLYVRIIIPQQGSAIRGALLWIVISTATILAHIKPTISALSGPGVSVIVLAALSAVVSALALLTVYLDARLCMQMKSPWAQITFFPVLWATLWWGVSKISPIGRLITWSPVLGFGQYKWLTAYTGQAGIDWIVAAWAVVVSQAVGTWFLSKETDVQLIPHETPPDVYEADTKSSQSSAPIALASILLGLTVPSYVFSSLPIAPYTSGTTPLTLGCVLPSSLYSKHSYISPLDDFIATSKKMTAAQVILWPEGAVKFDSEEMRADAFERVRQEIQGPYVGIGFEEPINMTLGSGRGDKKRTGLTLVGPNGPVVTYYKRNLVPIAESFSLDASGDPPTIYSLELTHPKNTAPTQWNPDAPHTRPIPITSSICLDFSSPSVFAALPSRPALILAPSRTWHPSVSVAMWEQAKARAAEVGSAVLWCDGGEGGVSGVAASGIDEITQVGDGFWIRTIGVAWPFDDRRTVYARIGEYPVIIAFWVLLEGGILSVAMASGAVLLGAHVKDGKALIRRKVQAVVGAVGAWRGRRHEERRQEREGSERESLL